MVLHISTGKNPLNVGVRALFRFQVAVFIHLQLITKEVSIRIVTNRYKKTLDGQLNRLVGSEMCIRDRPLLFSA